MNKPQTIEGCWWIHGDEKPAHFGVLSFNPESGLELTVKILQNRGPDEAFLYAFDSDYKPPRVIHGKDIHHNPVTLFGNRSWKTSISSGLDTYRIQSSVGILNCFAASWNEARFQVACINFTHLDAWMDRRLELDHRIEGDLTSIKFKSREHLEYDLRSDVRLRIEGSIYRGHASEDLRLGWVHRGWLIFAKPLAAKKIYDDYASVFLRLLCLLTGERVFIEKFSFYNYDPFEPGENGPPKESELLLRNSGITEAKRGTHVGRMIASFHEIESNFGSILKRWLECHERLEPVLDLYFATAHQASSYESRFLYLAQVLEVYHTRSENFSSSELSTEAHKERIRKILEGVPAEFKKWVSDKLAFSNRKTLVQRIEEILTKFTEQASKLTKGVDRFAAKVRDTRNYYTHYAEELRQKGKVAEGLELRRIMFAVEDLLQICLLKELGIEGNPITRIIQRNLSTEYADEDVPRVLAPQAEDKDRPDPGRSGFPMNPCLSGDETKNVEEKK